MWTELVVELDAREAEALSDRLVELGAASVSVEDAAAGTSTEQPLFDEPGADTAAWHRARLRVLAEGERSGLDMIRRSCADIGIAAPALLAAEPMADLDWVRTTQAQFPPIRVSGRLWIVPSWARPPDTGAVNIVLDPGRAFGTGSHPTTLLCLEWLDTEIRGGETVLDYGCGSGILAIAAARLGAGRVLGVDIDEQALDTARANAALNLQGCAAHREFAHARQALEIQADIVVANILARPLLVLAPALARHTRPGGRIALAGLLNDQCDEVARHYLAWFDLDAPVERDGWARMSGTRRRS